MLPFPIMIHRENNPPQGQLMIAGNTTSTTTQNWIVPDRVTSICAVCVGCGFGGGGGLSYRNDIPVTPGETLVITIPVGGNVLVSRAGTPLVVAGSASGNTAGLGGKNANVINDGGGNGGTGRNISQSPTYYVGGGAGGYSGNGGTADATTGAGASGAGGGGGSARYVTGSPTTISPAGGVGLLGQGANGAPGGAGSGGSGRTYGGGSGTNSLVGSPTWSAGAVRIIWGPNRSYPFNAANVTPSV
mgnify:CR=1